MKKEYTFLITNSLIEDCHGKIEKTPDNIVNISNDLDYIVIDEIYYNIENYHSS